MKRASAREKGKGFERAVSSMVVRQFESYGISKIDCYRTPNSGGHPYASKTDPADIQMSAKLQTLFPFSIECKSGYKTDFNLRHFFNKEIKGIELAFLKQTVRSTEKAVGIAKTPMLVIKEDNFPPLVAVPESCSRYWDLLQVPVMTFYYADCQWRMLSFAEFLEFWDRVECGASI